ncbi:MAG: C40 family peptidase [Acidobacteriota bacterium]|nr:C40 family peptidase [Acidobacteriota bacterium]
MFRKATLLAVAVSTAACASTGESFAPRPFPTAPGVARGAGPMLAEPVSGGARTLTAEAVLSTAMGLQGVPYRLGGSDPATGFDCSGFVQYVLRQHAIRMPRTVIQQFDVGAVSRAAEAGDLVFFQTAGSKPSHVGIALDSQTFVHAPNSRGVVRVDRLDTPYWSGRFVGARRLF